MKNVNVSKVKKLLESYVEEIEGSGGVYNDKVKDGRSLKLEIYRSKKISWKDCETFLESKIEEVKRFCDENNILYKDIKVYNNVNASLRMLSNFRIKILN